MGSSRMEDAYDKELLRHIEDLIRGFQGYVKDAEGTEKEPEFVYALRVLVSLANMVLRKEELFHVELWHALTEDAQLGCAGEMLLRVKDYKGDYFSPYPAIMSFYENGYTAEIDAILFLAALGQFQHEERCKQISINISARSLRNPNFVTVTLERLKAIPMGSDKQIIVEIHESAPNLAMCRQVLELYRKFGVSFALDDIGLNMNDIFRLGEFDGIVEYLKIDRHTVCAPEGASNSLGQVVDFVRKLMPDVAIVAEGVKSPEHAQDIKLKFPDIDYVQGLYLSTDRDEFIETFRRVRGVDEKLESHL